MSKYTLRQSINNAMRQKNFDAYLDRLAIAQQKSKIQSKAKNKSNDTEK